MNSPRKRIAAIAVLWLVMGVLVPLQIWPMAASNWKSIALVAVFGPPLYVALEGLGSWLLSEKRGDGISSRKRSVVRMLIALLVVGTWFFFAAWFASSIQAL